MVKIRKILVVLLMLCFLTGCSGQAKKYDVNTLIVNGNGSLEEIAIEDFSDLAVPSEELETYVEEQIHTYNKENGKQVKKTYLNTKDMSQVKLAIKYKNIDSYNGFNMLDCKFVPFTEIEATDLQGTYTSKDGGTVAVSDFQNVEKAKVFVQSEKLNVVVKGDILYYNDQVIISDGIASTSGEKPAIIIFK